jgi:hypothetical protein
MASEIAERVLGWALRGQGPPPQAVARGLEGLSAPEPRLGQLVGALGARALARLHLAPPPFGDERPASASAIILAATIGCARAQPDVASAMLGALHGPRCTWDLILRHALVAPALAHVPEPLLEPLLETSALTQVLAYPVSGRGNDSFLFIGELRTHHDGRRLLIQAFSRPSHVPEILRWRASVLDRLRQDERALGLVLDVYEAMFLTPGHPMLELVPRFDAVLLEPSGVSDRALADTLALAEFWGPLRWLRATHGDEVRARRLLDVSRLLMVGRFYDHARPFLQIQPS